MPVVIAREVGERGESASAAAAQASVGVLVVVALVAMWIEKRPAFRVWWHTFKSEAAGKPAPRSSGGAG